MSTPMGGRTHQLRTIALGDDPRAWAALGFAVTGNTVRLGNTAVTLGGTVGGFLGWSLEGITHSLDGLAPVDGDAADQSQSPEGLSPGQHPNGITAIDHVVVNTGDMARTASALTGAGLQCRGGRSTSSYGSPMRQQFYWLGDVILELVGPDAGEPATDAPARVFGLALVADDLDATVAHLGDLAGTPRDAVQPGRRIAGIRGDRVGVSLPLAVMSPHPR